MSVQILDAMARGGFEQVLALHDRESGLRGFIALHDTSSGPAFGGIRRWSYIDEQRALMDCLRLSRAMSHKCALVGLPAGGGKMVIFDQEGLDVERAYRHIGRAVEQLGGKFYTGPDVGTGDRELAWVAAETRFVTSPGADGPGDLPQATCEGVFAGMAEGLRHLDGELNWSDKTVVIQGLGGVGARLARRLVEAGARVIGADIDPERAAATKASHGIEIVDPAREFDIPCDVFAPCAMGGILHDLTVKRLQARLVAGAANNILARSVHGEQLHQRNVLYIPDIAINSGALIRGAHFHLNGEREPAGDIETRVGLATRKILERASAENRPTSRVALEEADRILDERRGGELLFPVPS